ncbi:hypothetical protein ACFFRR_005896 [Megaselia abdita]
MKFLIPSVLLIAAVNSVPIVNSTETVAEQPKIDVTTSAPIEVSAQPSGIQQSKTTDLHYGGGNILDNPSYNPDLLNSIIAIDPIQQYLNNYGPYPGYPHQPPPPPVGPVPYGAPLYPYAVRTGYEGFLVPDIRVPSEQQSPQPVDALSTVLRGIFPRMVAFWIAKLITLVISAVGLMFFGGAITTAFCSITSLCNKSFSDLPFLRNVENVTKAIGEEVTVERVRRAAELLQSAIDKYEQLQTLSALVGNGKK